jgi:two-component system copper resistance phosphate regulon response regulator CusR
LYLRLTLNNSIQEHTAAAILVVEDDHKIAQALRRGLNLEGYETTVARNGQEGLDLLTSQVFDALVLDWMLPEKDGIEVLRALSSFDYKPPVLLLTARDSVEDRVLGLESGADDYLVKPFAFAELVARVRVMLRRSKHSDNISSQMEDLSLDVISRRVWRSGNEIVLTPREFDLLAYFMRYQKQVVTRQMLGNDVWRETRRTTSLNNVIDVHIARLRRKLDERGEQSLIHTVRGVGFVMSKEKPK